MHPTLPVRLVLFAAAPLAAQIVNPATQQPQGQNPPQGEGQPLRIEGRQVSELREEDRVGSYGQPEWTTVRRFPETRVYVRPENTFGFEYWLLPEIAHGGKSTTTATQYEFEVGLPGRVQIDWYIVSHEQGNQGPMQFDEQKFEGRYALADWDVIWGNPTVYLEWSAENNAADHVETKLLLGGEICPSWHWGSNLVFEHETGGAQTNSYEWTGGVSKTLADQRFSAGAEFKMAFADQQGDRGLHDMELLIGPSLQYRPVPRAHMDLAPLFGVNADSPQVKFYFVFGWEF